MAKVSDTMGWSSYKDWVSSLEGFSYKEINPVPEAVRKRLVTAAHNPVKLSRNAPIWP